MADFYDELAPFYHLIFEDWSASIALQGGQLSQIIQTEWSGSSRVLDVSCGIGTQSIGLAAQGYSVSGSDLSAAAIDRARNEAAARQMQISFSVADIREASPHHGDGFDVVISADNSVPHLLGDEQILQAFSQMHACLRPGGGCLITVRDYNIEPRGRDILKPIGVRVSGGKRYLLFQVWDFAGECYDLKLFIIEEDLQTGHVLSRVFQSKYYAISTDKLMDLLTAAGFRNVRRLDGRFCQPVLIGTKRNAQ